ncbi:MAG: myo-inositol-1-phosphate synthase [Candidatus Micrarchaeota archaeon]|nr:myo-inositol-1-phosphate synthase [Candidatus Micrarchaeota archaeon]
MAKTNGRIRVGVIGVGNCFAGLYQGLEYYRTHHIDQAAGLMHPSLGGYQLSDIEFVSAFDVAVNKVGKKLHEAAYASPNAVRWLPQMPPSAVVVQEAPVLDGLGVFVLDRVHPVKNKPLAQLSEDIKAHIAATDTRVLLCYLPVGSQKACEFWAQMALDTGCAFVNCLPVFIASDPVWAAKFEKAGLPIVGDDIKAQVGSTIVHRSLAKLVDDRGALIEKTYQINVGGNTDFLNMKEHSRLQSKKISKTEAVQSQLKKRLPDDNIYIGPSDFIPFLSNTKLGFMRIEGRMWADVPFNLEIRLEVDDKANSGGVSVDAIRCAQIALDRGLSGSINGPSAYFMKHPPKQYADSVARQMVEDYIEGKN